MPLPEHARPQSIVHQPLSTRIRPIGFAGGLLALVGAGRWSQARAAEDRIKVAATTGQVADLARNVGGDHVDVAALMGAGVDPHLFKASERNVVDLIDSDVIFFNGLHLEGKLGEVLEQIGKRRPSYPVGEGIPDDLLTTPESFEGNPDPHVWFDPTMWTYTIDVAVEGLSELAPEFATDFEVNGHAYKTVMAELHEYAQVEFGTIPDQQRVLVTAHDAFGYLGRRYDIEVVGLQGISTATEAGVRDVQRIADILVERQVPTIFVETSVPKRTIEAVQVAARDRGWEVKIGQPLYSDALGDQGTEEGTYAGMFRYDVNAIVRGLRAGSES